LLAFQFDNIPLELVMGILPRSLTHFMKFSNNSITYHSSWREYQRIL